MVKFADLHMHTTYSDGSETPARVVEIAAESGLACISITDHDTVSGVQEAVEAGSTLGIEVLSGIEMSTYIGNKSVHILGYLIDCTDDDLLKTLMEVKVGRAERMEKMLKNLSSLGIDVSMSDFLEFVGEGVVGRALLAKYLVGREYYVSMDEAFEKALGDGRPACEPIPTLLPEDAINLIKKAGGVSSLAHPACSDIDSYISSFVDAGLDAIEVYTPRHEDRRMQKYFKMTEKYGLMSTGGSDSHGDIIPDRSLGNLKLDYEHVERLKERAASMQATLV